MPARRVARRQGGEGAGRREHVDGYGARTRTPLRVTRWCPAQQDVAAHGQRAARLVRNREKRAVRQRLDGEPMAAFAAAVEALPMQYAVDVVGAARTAIPAG